MGFNSEFRGLNRRTGGRQRIFRLFREEKNPFPLPEFESRSLQAIAQPLYHCVIPIYERKYMNTK
jgi:hypothetical protein